ncbi:hypothetical protein METHPM2_160024 [Pseudomonas sp. PM2]
MPEHTSVREGDTTSCVGTSAMAVCQSLNLQLNHRLRRQASSHIGYVLPTKSAPGADPLWERACPRRRCVSH